MSGGFWWRAVIGYVLAGAIILLAYNTGGKEGPCSSESSFVRSFDPGGTDFRVEHRSWPPGQTCVALGEDGRELASRTYPRPVDWLLAALAGLSPFAVRRSLLLVASRRRPSRA